jgi:hypothetical protein
VNSYFGQGMHPAAASNSEKIEQRSWAVIGAAGTTVIDNLANNPSPLQLVAANFNFDALSLDCNGNGIWDQCDIGGGASEDANGNGIPDECDERVVECPSDVNGDGVTNVDDLLLVIGSWGICPLPCPADVVADGQVNVDDLLAVIGGWGPCG